MAVPVMAVAKLGLGAYQQAQGSKIKPKRPTYKVPSERRDVAATYGQLAQGGVPGSKAAVEDIQRSTQNVISQAGNYTSSSANLLSMIAQSQATESNALRAAETQRKQTQLGLIDRYMGAKGQIAQEKQTAWEYNKRQKFEEEAAAKSQLQGAAIENLYAGGADLAGQSIINNKDKEEVDQPGVIKPNRKKYDMKNDYSGFPVS